MDVRYLACPCLKEIDPLIKEQALAIGSLQSEIEDLRGVIRELQDKIGRADRTSEDAYSKAHNAYRRSEEVERSVEYKISDLSRKIR